MDVAKAALQCGRVLFGVGSRWVGGPRLQLSTRLAADRGPAQLVWKAKRGAINFPQVTGRPKGGKGGEGAERAHQ